MDLRQPDRESQPPRVHPVPHLALGLWLRRPRRGGVQFIELVALVQKAASCPHLTSVSRIEIRLWFPIPGGLRNTSWERTCVIGY